MKRYFSLILALLTGVFGFGFSDKPVESRAALLSAQPLMAEITVAAAPAPEKEIKAVVPALNEPVSLTAVEETTVPSTLLATEPATEKTTEQATEKAAETTKKAEETTKTAEETTKEETTKKEKNSVSFMWPADINAEIIAGYPSYSNGSAHWGVDIGLYDDGTNVSRGTPILAACDGVVVTAYNDGNWNTGFGNYCIIDHGNGVQTLYAHSSDIQVSEGDAVKQGQVIGIVGDTGNTTAPHLHFEVRVENGNGGYKRVNPLKFISEP